MQNNLHDRASHERCLHVGRRAAERHLLVREKVIRGEVARRPQAMVPSSGLGFASMQIVRRLLKAEISQDLEGASIFVNPERGSKRCGASKNY